MEKVSSIKFQLPWHMQKSEKIIQWQSTVRITLFAAGVITTFAGLLALSQIYGLANWNWTIGMIGSGILFMQASFITYIKKEIPNPSDDSHVDAPTSTNQLNQQDQSPSPSSPSLSSSRSPSPQQSSSLAQTSSFPITSPSISRSPSPQPSTSQRRSSVDGLNVSSFPLELWSLTSKSHPQKSKNLLPSLDLPDPQFREGNSVYFTQDQLKDYLAKIQQQRDYLLTFQDNCSSLGKEELPTAIRELIENLEEVDQKIIKALHSDSFKMREETKYFVFHKDHLPKVYSEHGNRYYQTLYLAMLSYENEKIGPQIKELIRNILSQIRDEVNSSRRNIEQDVKLFREFLLQRFPDFNAYSGKNGMGVDRDALMKILNIFYIGDDISWRYEEFNFLTVCEAENFRNSHGRVGLLSNRDWVCLGYGHNSSAHYVNFLYDAKQQEYLLFNNLHNQPKKPKKLANGEVSIAMKKNLFDQLPKEKLPDIKNWKTPQWGDNNCFLSSAFMLVAIYDAYYSLCKKYSA